MSSHLVDKGSKIAERNVKHTLSNSEVKRLSRTSISQFNTLLYAQFIDQIHVLLSAT